MYDFRYRHLWTDPKLPLRMNFRLCTRRTDVIWAPGIANFKRNSRHNLRRDASFSNSIRFMRLHAFYLLVFIHTESSIWASHKVEDFFFISLHIFYDIYFQDPELYNPHPMDGRKFIKTEMVRYSYVFFRFYYPKIVCFLYNKEKGKQLLYEFWW